VRNTPSDLASFQIGSLSSCIERLVSKRKVLVEDGASDDDLTLEDLASFTSSGSITSRAISISIQVLIDSPGQHVIHLTQELWQKWLSNPSDRIVISQLALYFRPFHDLNLHEAKSCDDLRRFSLFHGAMASPHIVVLHLPVPSFNSDVLAIFTLSTFPPVYDVFSMAADVQKNLSSLP
jgi:hypothetical protein